MSIEVEVKTSAIMLAALRRMARYPCNTGDTTHMPTPTCVNREVFCIGRVPCFPCWAAEVLENLRVEAE